MKTIKKCVCDDPSCAKCLGSNCMDLDCKVHTKLSKIRYKTRLLKDVENRIESLKRSGESVNLRHPLRQQIAELKWELDDLKGIEPQVTIDYKPGYGPNGNAWVRLQRKIAMGLLSALFIIIPVLVLAGLIILLAKALKHL